MKTKIYALQDENGKIRYIGKTYKGLSKRLIEHLSVARSGKKNHRCNWMRSVMTRGYIPAITLIGEIKGDGCREEAAWIKYFRDEGVNLVNATDGGEGVPGWKPSEEMREQFRITTTEHMKSPAARLKSSIAHKNSPLVQAQCVRLKIINKGKQVSIKMRKRYSASNKNNPLVLKHIAELAHAKIGKHHSEETLKKLRFARHEWWRIKKISAHQKDK